MYRVSLLPRKVLITTDEVISQSHVEGNVSPKSLLSAIQIAEDRFIKPAIGKDIYQALRNQKNVVVTDINITYLQGLFNGEPVLPEEDEDGDVDEENENDPEELPEEEPVEEDPDKVVLAVGEIVNAFEFIEDQFLKDLWIEYLWKICAECVVYTASPTNYIRFTAEGEMQNNPKTVNVASDGKGAASVELSEMKWKMDKMLMDRIDPLLAAMHEWICENKALFPTYPKPCPCNDNKDGISYQRKSAWVHVYDNGREDGCCN